MSPGPWTKISTHRTHSTQHFDIYQDDVIGPDGREAPYDWVKTNDQVRVVAFLGGDRIILIKQSHYLIGETLQLPGGNLDGEETPQQAGRRELEQEAGIKGGEWRNHGKLSPLPGLTPAAIHLLSVRNADQAQPNPESSEADLRIVRMGLIEAVRAVRDGLVGCAASAALILALGGQEGANRG